jgi:hypothetical protein
MSEEIATRTQDGSTDRTDQDTAATPTAKTPLTRRSLLAGLAGAAGAIAVQAASVPLPAGAANGSTAKVGQTNTGTNPTTFQNTRHAANARGLRGRTTWTGAAASSAGVEGESKGADGIGVFGKAHNGAGARAVLGIANEGTGVRGQGGPTGVSGTGDSYGVRGTSTSNYGVAGEGGYAGVLGTGGSYGVYGTGTSAGVTATTSAGYGVYAQGPVGVVGIGSGSGRGVWGYNSASGGYGVVGEGGYRGVYASGGNAGVYGTSGYVGVWGVATGSTGLNYGVYASTSSSGGYAGVFAGPVYVSGFLTKVGGGFKIDHPLEPKRRYLVHSFVESSEMLNVYSGRVTLNSRGRATVRLPRYFEAANKQPRYQLTAIGDAAPNLHVAKEVAGNRFVVAGGPAGLVVSWQVTAARDDQWARKNPMKVEPLKGKADRGKLLQPRAFGEPRSSGIMALPTARPKRVQRKPERIPAKLRRAGGVR